MSLLTVTGLRVGYGFLVLRDLTLEIGDGERAVVFGLNGAGKTTTVSTIAGLLTPDLGTIRFDGVDITRSSASERVDMGIVLVPEGRRVFPALSVRNNLRLGAWTRRRRPTAERVRAEELVFDYFPRLAERADQAAGTLSGGEQQMLAIGRALISQPWLLLIDEASLGLSPSLVQTVFQVVDRINTDGVTVVLVEQNAGVLPHADRVLILEKGSLMYQGTGEGMHATDLRATYLGHPGGTGHR
jgi:branched-chain amino acid transport system ATP-binding protein